MRIGDVACLALPLSIAVGSTIGCGGDDVRCDDCIKFGTTTIAWITIFGDDANGVMRYTTTLDTFVGAGSANPIVVIDSAATN